MEHIVGSEIHTCFGDIRLILQCFFFVRPLFDILFESIIEQRNNDKQCHSLYTGSEEQAKSYATTTHSVPVCVRVRVLVYIYSLYISM